MDKMKRLVDLLWLLKKVKYAKEVQPLKVQKITELAQAVKMVNLGETIYQEKSTS